MGPSVANNASLNYDDRFQENVVEPEIPQPVEFVEQPVNLAFVILPILTLVLGVVLLVIMQVGKGAQDWENLVQKYAVVWVLINLACTFFGLYEVIQFNSDVRLLENEVDQFANELVSTSLGAISPMEISTKLPGGSPLGVLFIFLPPLSTATLERLFTFPEFVPSSGPFATAFQNAICTFVTSNCVDGSQGKQEFFARYENKSVSDPNLFMVGKVRPNQDYFVVPLILLLALDILTLLLLGVMRALKRFNVCSESTFRKSNSRVETWSLVLSVLCTFAVVGLLIFLPILYETELYLLYDGVLLRNQLGVGLYVEPNPERLRLQADGELTITLDSSDDISICDAEFRGKIDRSW